MILDVSLGLNSNLPVWPGEPEVSVHRTMDLDRGDECTVSRLSCGVHVGTHVDAPAHFVAGGGTVEDLDLDRLIGDAVVADLSNVREVTARDLNELGLPSGTKRLLLKTSNSALWAAGVSEFRPNFVALTPDAARWVVKTGVELIGVDYLSVQLFADEAPDTHRILLEAGVVIVEGLDLHRVAPGRYRLICLPLKLLGAEGAPARAVLLPAEEG